MRERERERWVDNGKRKQQRERQKRPEERVENTHHRYTGDGSSL